MFTGTVVSTAIVLLVIGCSVREKMRLMRNREKDWDKIGEAKSSPLSKAIINMVGIAGGIYLSMVLVITFLELNVPDRLNFGFASLEPVAAFSIFLAVIQPFIIRILQLRKPY